jgi:hypothetical protein
VTPASSPFVVALGADFGRLAPAVRRHLAQDARSSHLAGTVRAWRRGGALGWILARAVRLTATEATPFELRNELRVDASGSSAMLWRRTARGGLEATGLVRWDPRRGALVDSIGPCGAIRVELLPRVDAGALELVSRRQWLHLLGLRVPLPRALVGHARARERAAEGGAITLTLALFHPWLGEYAGYEATLREAPR